MLLSQGHDARMKVFTCHGQEHLGKLTVDLRVECSAAVRGDLNVGESSVLSTLVSWLSMLSLVGNLRKLN